MSHRIAGVRMHVELLDAEGDHGDLEVTVFLGDSWAGDGLADFVEIRTDDGTNLGVPLDDVEKALELVKEIRRHQAADDDA